VFSTYVASYDGDGEVAREFLQEDVTNTSSYKVRSTVLGKLVTVLNNSGSKIGTAIPIDETVTPAQTTSANTGGVPFPTYNDPLHQSIAGDRKTVWDPLGNAIAWRPWPGGPPPNSYPRSSGQFGSLGSSFGSAQERGCSLDGVPENCDTVMRAVNNGYPGQYSVGSNIDALQRGLTEITLYRGSDSQTIRVPYFFHNFRNPQSPALAERAAKNCATPNSLLRYFNNEFEDQWKRTQKSGEENGSLLFYEKSNNTYPRVQLSEGSHVTDRITSVPALPESRKETRKAIQDYKNEGRDVYFLAVFHTHPDFSPGDPRSGEPSPDDVQFQSDFKNVLGIIRTSKGYTFFSNGKKFDSTDARANECITTLNSRRE